MKICIFVSKDLTVFQSIIRDTKMTRCSSSLGVEKSVLKGRHPPAALHGRRRSPQRRALCGRRGARNNTERPTTAKGFEKDSSSVVIADVLNAQTPEDTLGMSTRRRRDQGIEKETSSSSIRKAFSERIKKVHPDVCNNERGSEEATEKCVRAYAYLLSTMSSSSEGKEDEGLGDFDDVDAERDVFGSVFVNEIACVGVSNCPSYCNCTHTAREYFSTNPKTGAARFDRSEKSHAVKTATEAEQYALHLAQQQCPRLCIHWLDKSQTKACETELQKAIDGLEMIDDTALRLEYMISAFTAENRLVERELRAAENRRARTRATTSTTQSWWK